MALGKVIAVSHNYLIVILNFINNKDTDCIYLNYAKMFDKVAHEFVDPQTTSKWQPGASSKLD